MDIKELESVLKLGRQYGASSLVWGSFKIEFMPAVASEPEPKPAELPAEHNLGADDTMITDEIRFWSSSDSSAPLAGDE